jgi:phosphoglucosamine mutase
MRAHGFNVGGEQSGHIVLSDFSTTGDGLIAALQVLAMVRASGKAVSEVCAVFEPVPQVLKNVRCRAHETLDLPPVRQAIDEAIERLGSAGRLVIRPSGTEPLIRVMAEGDDAAAGQRGGRSHRHHASSTKRPSPSYDCTARWAMRRRESGSK